MNQVLESNFVGIHKLKVKQIQTTEYTRQVSKTGVTRVEDSIKARGWIAANAPYVLVPREQLPDGKQTVWSSDVLSNLNVFCLDGNHRLRALSTLYGAEYELDVRLYLHFDDDVMLTALARSVNNTTGDTAVTTAYDRLFSCKKSMEALMVKEKLGTDASKVTARMLSEAYKKSGDCPPTPQTLCNYKRIVLGLKGPAFKALREISESEEKKVDRQSLSLTLLDCDIILKFPAGREFEQALLIHILSRFKAHEGNKTPTKGDLPKLKQRALGAGELYQMVTSVVPYECLPYPKLVLRKPKRSSRSAREVSDLLVWGDLIVYNTPKAAIESLDQDDVDEEYVRLLRIATNAQLQIMLEPGTERCTPEAALYLRVDKSCPIFWARWHEVKSKADLDVCCDIPQRGSRDKVLGKVKFGEDGNGGVKVRHVRNKPSATTVYTDNALFISTACGRVVGSGMFNPDSGEGGDGDEEEEEEEEAEADA